jgi:hypothetical protein
MAMMKFEILFKSSDAAEARAEFDSAGVVPLAMVVKRVGPQVTDYLVCKPFVGDAFDRVADQILSLDVLTRENVADQDAAEAAREGRMEGLILEYSNGTDVEIFSSDGNFVHNMLNDAGDETLTADGAHTNDGAHRAREGWASPADVPAKPTGQAFNDYQSGGHTEGNSLN